MKRPALVQALGASSTQAARGAFSSARDGRIMRLPRCGLLRAREVIACDVDP